MTHQEEAAFYKELCRRGIAMFELSKDVLIVKRYTPIDDRTFLDGTNDIKKFSSEDEAIEFLNSYINWTWENSEEEEEETVEETASDNSLHYFRVIMLMDIGLGPQEVDLGLIPHACDTDNWHEFLQAEGEHKGSLYIEKYIKEKCSEMKFEDVKYQVRIRPAQQ